MSASAVQTHEPFRISDIWNKAQYRSLLFQAVLAIAVIVLFLFAASYLQQNYERQGKTFSFDFLWSVGSFQMNGGEYFYKPGETYIVAIAEGVINTIYLALFGIIAATLLGFVMGVARLSKNWLVAKIGTVYVEAFRNVPLLVQIFFWYAGVLGALQGPRKLYEKGQEIWFGLNSRGLYMPGIEGKEGFNLTLIAIVAAIIIWIVLGRWARQRFEKTGQPFPAFLTGLGILIALPLFMFIVTGMPADWDIAKMQGFNLKGGMRIIPEYAAMFLALTIYTGAFIAETVRSGIQAVSQGQWEAAGALGLRRSVILRKIIIPQAMRVIVPPLISQYLNLTKNTSLAVAIGYWDLFSVSTGPVLQKSGKEVEVILIVMGLYLLFSLGTSGIMNVYNSRVALKER